MHTYKVSRYYFQGDNLYFPCLAILCCVTVHWAGPENPRGRPWLTWLRWRVTITTSEWPRCWGPRASCVTTPPTASPCAGAAPSWPVTAGWTARRPAPVSMTRYPEYPAQNIWARWQRLSSKVQCCRLVKILASYRLLNLSVIISIKANKHFPNFSRGTWTLYSVEIRTSPQFPGRFPWMPLLCTWTRIKCQTLGLKYFSGDLVSPSYISTVATLLVRKIIFEKKLNYSCYIGYLYINIYNNKGGGYQVGPPPTE